MEYLYLAVSQYLVARITQVVFRHKKILWNKLNISWVLLSLWFFYSQIYESMKEMMWWYTWSVQSSRTATFLELLKYANEMSNFFF